jgi:hypothetical protein
VSLLAYVDGQPLLADPALRQAGAVCGDGHSMVPKCGELVTWHWAHEANTDCVTCSEESPWHLEWKSVAYRLGCQIEVGMLRGSERRRADIVAGGWIVELQHGYLTPAEIRGRENFYGSNLLWIYDAQRFAARMSTWPAKQSGELPRFRIKQPPLSLATHSREVFFDLRTIRQRAEHDWEWQGPSEEYAGVCPVRMWTFPSKYRSQDLLYGEIRPPTETAEEFLSDLIAFPAPDSGDPSLGSAMTALLSAGLLAPCVVCDVTDADLEVMRGESIHRSCAPRHWRPKERA